MQAFSFLGYDVQNKTGHAPEGTFALQSTALSPPATRCHARSWCWHWPGCHFRRTWRHAMFRDCEPEMLILFPCEYGKGWDRMSHLEMVQRRVCSRGVVSRRRSDDVAQFDTPRKQDAYHVAIGKVGLAIN